MIFRIATIADIEGMQVVRHAVKENRLSDPSLVPDRDVEDYIMRRGRGWVCERDGMITGFSIISLTDNNVWALFVHPQGEQQGIGSRLHELMLNWYFDTTDKTVWLSTAPFTRAERFYEMKGWKKTGITTSGETRFEMTASNWELLRS